MNYWISNLPLQFVMFIELNAVQHPDNLDDVF